MDISSLYRNFAMTDWNSVVEKLCATAQMFIGFAAAASIPILIFYFRYRAKRELTRAWHEQRLAAIEKGVELPPIPEALLNGGRIETPRPAVDRSRWVLLAALICMSGGMGVLFCFGGGDRDRAMRDFAHLGGVAAMLGLGLLVFWIIIARHKRPAASGE